HSGVWVCEAILLVVVSAIALLFASDPGPCISRLVIDFYGGNARVQVCLLTIEGHLEAPVNMVPVEIADAAADCRSKSKEWLHAAINIEAPLHDIAIPAGRAFRRQP